MQIYISLSICAIFHLRNCYFTSPLEQFFLHLGCIITIAPGFTSPLGMLLGVGNTRFTPGEREREREREMDPKLYKAAKEGDVMYLAARIVRMKRTEEEDLAAGVLRINRTLEEDNRYGRSEEYLLDRTQHGNNNIVHIAARAGRDLFVAVALQFLPVLSNQVNSQGDTPLLAAARFGRLKVVETITKPQFKFQIRRDMAVATTTLIRTYTSSSSSRRRCCQRDEEEGLVDHPLELGTIHDDMATTVDNGTKSSSSHRQRDAEEVLVDRQLIHGTTALHEALRNGHEEVARYLLSLDPEMATFVSGAGESPLFLAVESRCELFVVDILQSNRPYSTKGPDGLNVLHVARDCCGKIISILITQKPHLMRQKDDRGKAAIHYAVEANYWVLVDQMLKADALIALFPEDDGHTPLLRAASSGRGKICEKILEICPESIDARNRKGRHALHLCKCRDARFLMRIPEILELLNVGDDEGNTPLHLAIKENDYEKSMLLSSSNSVDLGAVNKEGLTALDLCRTDWKNAHKQRLMWLHLTIRGAPRGRLQNEYKVPVGERIEDFNPVINTMALVATLIATVTFAAAFTMPGGYDTSPDNMGVANLAKKAALRAFILSDTIAMLFSIIAVLALGLAVYFEQEMQRRICFISWALINLAMRGSLVAFMSGLFVVTAPKDLWEAISVCIICSTVTLALELSVPFLFSPSIRDLHLIFRRKTHQWLKDLREFTSRRSSSMA